MATVTGENLLQSIIESADVEINALIFGTLSARLQQMIDNGTYSKLAAGIAMSGFSSVINDATSISALSDAVETNTDLIEAAAEGEVDQIAFPPVEEGGDENGEATIVSADIGTITDWAFLDAAQDSFIFTDDASDENFVAISNFTDNDQIRISNLPAGESYQFVANGNDVDISYNFNDEAPMNFIRLIGVGSETDVYENEAGFEDAIGFNAVIYA